MKDPHDALAARFQDFAAAVAAVDVDAFVALCVHDEVPERELFEDNAQKLKEAGLGLRIKRISQEGEVAEVYFDVVDKGGAAEDEGMVTFTLEADGWRLRAL